MSKKRKILLFIIFILIIISVVVLFLYLRYEDIAIKCVNAIQCDCSNGKERCKCHYYNEDKTISSDTVICDRNFHYEKPVLYLYPVSDNTEVSVSFQYPNNLLTTYPKYVDSWKVIANTDGSLYDSEGNYYYALYWEEDHDMEANFNEGFYVTKEDAIPFLEEKLSAIGLNLRERNEFIMYWLPILEKNEKSLVEFKLTDELQEHNRLIIEPEPDSLLRVMMFIKKVDKEVSIKEQTFDTFERRGFSAVEWGGVILK